MNIIEFIKNNESVQRILLLIGGVAIGAIFYPSKNIEEKYKMKYEQEIVSIKEQHSKQTQDLQESLAKASQTNKTIQEETQIRIFSLTTQLRELKNKQKTSHYKLIKPDGTIEEKSFTESESQESSSVVSSIQQEYTKKISEIESRWENIHKQRTIKIAQEFQEKEKQYQKTITEQEYIKNTYINPKKYGIAGGYLSKDTYYFSGEADVFGPIYLQIHGQTGKSDDIGGGIGIRF